MSAKTSHHSRTSLLRGYRALTLLVVIAINSSALAQNIFGDPNYGSIELDAGFSPDPHVTDLAAGGSTEFDSCTGYFSGDPDLNLNYEAGNFDLGIFAKSDTDTTLAINNPSGEWLCNDDSDIVAGSNPAILIENPESGLYNIWVGVYSEDSAFESAKLAITELDKSGWAEMDLNASEVSSISSLDISADPSYGSVNLDSGFLPDPNVSDILIGGSFESDQPTCVGYFSSAPDLNLNYVASSGTVLGIFAVSDVDTTIAINTPNGKWVCNDDSEYLSAANPGVLFDSPATGLYNIWVGAYSSDDALEANASLVLTELSADNWSTMALSTTADDNESNDEVVVDRGGLTDQEIPPDEGLLVEDDAVTEETKPNSRVQFGRKNN